MAKVVRVSNGEEWRYVPAEGKYRSRLERFAKLGMAQVSNGTVRLKSDAGPIIWDLIVVNRGTEDHVAKALDALEDDCVRLVNNEKLCFGKKGKVVSYNDFVDLSLVKEEGEGEGGLKVGIKPIEDGQVLLTAWPKTKRLIPARANVANRRVWLELAEPQKEGRCFVLDERGESVLTASFKADGDEAVRVICPCAIDSWLMAVGSEAVVAGGRYEIVSGEGQNFVIRDTKAGREYAGRFFHNVSDPVSIGFERMRMERLLASKGIGSILPSYQLRKRGESQ